MNEMNENCEHGDCQLYGLFAEGKHHSERGHQAPKHCLSQ